MSTAADTKGWQDYFERPLEHDEYEDRPGDYGIRSEATSAAIRVCMPGDSAETLVAKARVIEAYLRGADKPKSDD